MSVVERKVEYFTNSGLKNTEKVIESIKNRIRNGGVRTVVVASTSGETGVKIAKALKELGKENIPEDIVFMSSPFEHLTFIVRFALGIGYNSVPFISFRIFTV